MPAPSATPIVRSNVNVISLSAEADGLRSEMIPSFPSKHENPYASADASLEEALPKVVLSGRPPIILEFFSI